MPNFIKIGERLLNLDTIAFVERVAQNGQETVTIFYERMRKIYRPLDRPGPAGTPTDPIIFPLNMTFHGGDARYVWEKLSALAEVWAPPGEIEPGAGGWPTSRA